MGAQDVATDFTKQEAMELDSDWSSSSDAFKHNDFHHAITFHEFTFVNFYADWCGHCKVFHPTWKDMSSRLSEKMPFTTAQGQTFTIKFMKINCVDFKHVCMSAKINAFPTLRLYKRDGTFEAFQEKRDPEKIIDFLTNTVRKSSTMSTRHHWIFSEGCRVSGVLRVDRVAGHFGIMAESHGMTHVNPALTNVSHTVHHFGFGAKLSPEDVKLLTRRITFSSGNGEADATTQLMFNGGLNVNPINRQSFIAERFHEAPQHYLKVVRTDVDGYKIYQMTHSDRIRRLRKDGDNEKAPQARFSYDFSPIKVVVREIGTPWYEFVTHLFAILGGAYTMCELCSGAVETAQSAVKERMGKAL